MPLLMLVLALLVIGAIAVVASGRGEGLDPDELAHDRVAGPLAHLPPSGEPVRAADLEGLRFSVVARGYRPQEVEAVLDRLADEIAERDSRIDQLERRERAGVESPAPAAAGKVVHRTIERASDGEG